MSPGVSNRGAKAVAGEKRQLAPGRVVDATRTRDLTTAEHAESNATRASTEGNARAGARPGGTQSAARKPVPAPASSVSNESASALYRLTLTVDREFTEKLDEARALVSHAVPDEDLARVLELGLDALLERTRRRKFAERAADPAPKKPGSTDRSAPVPKATDGENERRRSRQIPAEIRRQVWTRDGERCTFVDPRGRRCEARWFLQLDHIRPFASGGANDASNLRVRCGLHSRHRNRRGSVRSTGRP